MPGKVIAGKVARNSSRASDVNSEVNFSVTESAPWILTSLKENSGEVKFGEDCCILIIPKSIARHLLLCKQPLRLNCELSLLPCERHANSPR